MPLGRPPRAVTVARLQAIEITLDWRWGPVMVLGTWLLAQNVLPARFPTWEVETTWLTAGAAVLAGEVALLLHELSHALLARWRGQRVTRIVFHGFQAQTVVEPCASVPESEILIALAGPATNLALAVLFELVRVATRTQGALDVLLLMLVIGNTATAVLSMLPLGNSDGARALSGLRRRSRSEAQVARQGENEDDKNQEPQRRPAVVAPAAGAAKSAAE